MSESSNGVVKNDKTLIYTDINTDIIKKNKFFNKKINDGLTDNLTKLTTLNVNEQVAKDFLTFRKANKAPLTQTVLNSIIEQANIVGISLNDAIKFCLVNNWRTFI